MDLIQVINENSFIQLSIVIMIGLIFGSLLNVIVNRLLIMENVYLSNIVISISNTFDKNIKEYFNKNKNVNLFYPESKCNNCDNKLKWYQNIPLISFLVLKGKCYYCKTKISFQYPLVEFTTLFGILIIYFNNNWGIDIFFQFTLFYFLFCIFLTDIKEKIIFDSVLFLLFINAFLTVYLDNKIIASDAVLKFICIYVFLYLFIYFYELLRKKESHIFGRGDIKLIAVLSIYLTLENILHLIICSAFLGIFYFIFLKIIKKEQMFVPFAPFIIIAFYIIYLF